MWLRTRPAYSWARCRIQVTSISSTSTASAALVAQLVNSPSPIRISIPPLRSTPCSCTRPSRTAGASPNANDQNTDPLPEPEQPATSVCGPTGSRHGSPSSRRPIRT